MDYHVKIISSSDRDTVQREVSDHLNRGFRIHHSQVVGSVWHVMMIKYPPKTFRGI